MISSLQPTATSEEIDVVQTAIDNVTDPDLQTEYQNQLNAFLDSAESVQSALYDAQSALDDVNIDDITVDATVMSAVKSQIMNLPTCTWKNNLIADFNSTLLYIVDVRFDSLYPNFSVSGKASLQELINLLDTSEEKVAVQTELTNLTQSGTRPTGSGTNNGASTEAMAVLTLLEGLNRLSTDAQVLVVQNAINSLTDATEKADLQSTLNTIKLAITDTKQDFINAHNAVNGISLSSVTSESMYNVYEIVKGLPNCDEKDSIQHTFNDAMVAIVNGVSATITTTSPDKDILLVQNAINYVSDTYIREQLQTTFTALLQRVFGTADLPVLDDTSLGESYLKVQSNLATAVFNNSSVKQTERDALNSLIASRTVVIELDDWVLTPATTTTSGAVTFTVDFCINGDVVERLPHRYTIAQLTSSSSSSHHSSSSSSSSDASNSNSSSSTTTEATTDTKTGTTGATNTTATTTVPVVPIVTASKEPLTQEAKDALLAQNKVAVTTVLGSTAIIPLVGTAWVNDGGTWLLYDNGSVNKGWKVVNNTWYFTNKDGLMKTGWVNIGGSNWYFLDNSGEMKTGWIQDSNSWYFAGSDGAIKTGWVKDVSGSWYYMKTDGSMASNATIDGYKLGSDGKLV